MVVEMIIISGLPVFLLMKFVMNYAKAVQNGNNPNTLPQKTLLYCLTADMNIAGILSTRSEFDFLYPSF